MRIHPHPMWLRADSLSWSGGGCRLQQASPMVRGAAASGGCTYETRQNLLPGCCGASLPQVHSVKRPGGAGSCFLTACSLRLLQVSSESAKEELERESPAETHHRRQRQSLNKGHTEVVPEVGAWPKCVSAKYTANTFHEALCWGRFARGSSNVLCAASQLLLAGCQPALCPSLLLPIAKQIPVAKIPRFLIPLTWRARTPPSLPSAT